MFILILNYVKPLAEVDAVRPRHVEFLKRYYQAGKFLCSGRQTPPVGGLIVCNAGSRAEAEAITREDPYAQSGVAQYQIIEFTAGMYAEGFEKFLG